MRRIVIDASVVLKWYLDEEELGHKALNMLTLYLSDELDLLAPSLLAYEVVNGLSIAQKRGRIDSYKLHTAIDGFFKLEIKLQDVSRFYTKIVDIIMNNNLSAYDASYIALADKEKIPFVTADKMLFNTVKEKLKFVRQLEEF